MTTFLEEALQKLTPSEKVYMTLTARQRDVYDMLSSGMLPKQIAYKFKCAERTVSVHIRNITIKANKEGLVWGRVLVKRP